MLPIYNYALNYLMLKQFLVNIY